MGRQTVTYAATHSWAPLHFKAVSVQFVVIPRCILLCEAHPRPQAYRLSASTQIPCATGPKPSCARPQPCASLRVQTLVAPALYSETLHIHDNLQLLRKQDTWSAQSL